jgi:hypothetical protein
MGNEMKPQRRRTNRPGAQFSRRLAEMRRSASRSLLAEQLEDRRLLSVDNPFYNSLIPMDVTGDFSVTPRDALVVINTLNANGSRKLDPSGTDQGLLAVDTNGDKFVTPRDALNVINALNRGEGAGELLGFRLELQDANGNKIEPLKDGQGNVITDGAGDPILAVRVGTTFRVQMYVDDLRTAEVIPPAQGGVFGAQFDVSYSDPAMFSLNGTKPDDFAANVAQFQSFFVATTPTGQQNPIYGTLQEVYPSINNVDGETPAVPNEFDELQSVARDLFNPTGSDEKVFVHVTLRADAVGKLTFQANPAEGVGEAPPENTLYGDGRNIPENLISFGFPLHVTIVKPITAQADSLDVVEDSTTDIDVLANDFLETGSTGTKAIGTVGTPAHGTATIVAGKVRYTPTLDYVGADTFTYTAVDGLGNSDTGTVTINVTPVNDPPVAVNDTYTAILEDSVDNVLDVLVNDNAGPTNEDQALTIDPATLTQPAHGTVTIDGGTLKYTPVADYFGPDSFQYSVIDGGGLKSALATVNITVNNVNDPPVVQNDQATGILEDSSNNSINVLANDSPGINESGVDSLTIISVQNFSQGGSATISGSSVIYKPAANFFGQETFTYTVRDTGGLEATATVTVTVSNVNDPVDAVDDGQAQGMYVDEFTTNNVLNVLANDSAGPNEDASALTITAVTALPTTTGTISIAPDGKSVLYTPGAGIFGPATDSFTYTISDGQYTDTATVEVTIDPVVRPRARDDSYTIAEDSGAHNLAVLGNDLFNAGATRTRFVVTVPPTNGIASVVGDEIVYTPNADFFGVDTFKYEIDDDFVDNGNESVASEAQVTITVNNVNDAPIALDDATTVQEDSVNNTINPLANDSPGPNEAAVDTMALVSVQGFNHGGSATISGSSLLYTPAADFFGVETFTYTMRDAAGLQATATITVTVNNVNDNPTAVADSFTGIQEDSTANPLNVLANDTITPDVGETLTITAVGVSGATAQGGTVTTDGVQVFYTPLGDFFGTDTFAYTISDGNGGTSTATVTLQVDNVNDAPTANQDRVMALKDFLNQELEVLPNDSIAPDKNETLKIVGLGLTAGTITSGPITTSQGGTASISADGTKIIYTPAAGFETDDTGVFDEFYYQISDRETDGLTSVALVEVDVLDAVPSDISGVIYLDVNNNGVHDTQEVELAGISVTLTGTNVRGEAVNLTVKTDVNGVFRFTGILPNAESDTVGYSISAATPKYLIDGLDTISDTVVDDNYTPGIAHNDIFTGIDLGLWGTQRSHNNYAFGERGLSSKYVSIGQYLASTKKGLAVATNMSGDDYWFTVLQGWEGIKEVDCQLASNLETCLLRVKDASDVWHEKTISYKKYYVAGDQAAGEYLIYFNGTAADLGFTLAANGEGEGEGEGCDPYDADFANGADQVFEQGEWA